MGIESPYLLVFIGLGILVLCPFVIVLIVKRTRSLGVVYGDTIVLLRAELFKLSLGVLVGLFVAVAFANPYYVGSAEANSTSCIDAIVLGDDSFSMTARTENGNPSRLERGKVIAAELVDNIGCANVAVCEFTSVTFCRAPFGSSNTEIHRTIEGFGADAITGSGSNIRNALNRLILEFPEESTRPKFIFLISDGGDDLTAAYYQKKLNDLLDHLVDSEISVTTIGIGEDYEVPVALIPIRYAYNKSRDKRYKEIDGTIYEKIYSKLEENKLRHIAASTGGIYLHEDEFTTDKIKSSVEHRLVSSGILKPATTSLSNVFIGAALLCLFLHLVFFKPSFRK